MKTMRKRVLGFTLLEAMVVLAVIAILTSLAVSSYNSQTTRTRRAEARAFLLDAANKQESFFTEHVSYTDVVVGSSPCSQISCGLGYASDESPTGLYTLSITTAPSGCDPGTSTPCTAYTLTATPIAADPECTTLTYTSTGVRDSTGGGTADDCWR